MNKWFYPSLFVIIPIGFFLRAVQYYSIIDVDTGYFNNSIYSNIVYIFLLVSAIFYIALLGLPSKKSSEPKHTHIIYSPQDKMLLFVCAVIGAVTAFTETGESGIIGILIKLFLLGSSSLFAMIGFLDRKSEKGALLQALLLSPVLYYILRLLFIFEAYTQVANISAYMLTLFSAGLFALFSMAYAKVIYRNGNPKICFFLGGMALSGLAVSGLSSYIVHLLGFAYNMDKTIVHPMSQLFDIAMGVYIIIAVKKLIDHEDFFRFIPDEKENAETSQDVHF